MRGERRHATQKHVTDLKFVLSIKAADEESDVTESFFGEEITLIKMLGEFIITIYYAIMFDK